MAGHVRVTQDPLQDRVYAYMGRERVSIVGNDLAYEGGMERVMSQLYDAAKRDVRASMSPLERPQPRVIRNGNRSSLAYPLHSGCSRARLHSR